MQQYFDAQMRLLTQAGKQFAESYPEHAGQLNIESVKDRDPHVERLLEGVAYLTANIQKRLDESVPEVAEQVLRQLCPILLNNYPSTTVFKFTPDFSMQRPLVIEKGLEIRAKTQANKVDCRFSTCHDLTLVPFVVSDARCKETYQGSVLRIKIKGICQENKGKHRVSTLRFYLHGDTALITSLYHLLMTGSEAIICDFGPRYSEFNATLGVQQGTAAHLDQNNALLCSAASSHPGYALLHDYFNAKDRFHFIDIKGFDAVLMPSGCDTFELVIKSSVKLPSGHKLSADNIQLNCVTGVNLFKQDAEPIRITPDRSDYMIVADQDKLEQIHVFAVDTVYGVEVGTGQRHAYLPRYKHILGDNSHLYTLSLQDIGADVVSHYIQIPFLHNHNKQHNKQQIKQQQGKLKNQTAQQYESISLTVTAYNGRWPRHVIKQGQLNQGGEGLPDQVSVANIGRPSNYRKRAEQSTHWQLISLLNLKFSSITQIDEFKRLLHLFDWSGRAENGRRIAAIEKISSEQVNQIKRGIFIQGAEIKITLDESKFICLSDCYHFSAVLHHFLVLYAPINQTVQTRVICIPSYTEFFWSIELGKSALL
jgi:type VI secretion system protein ImpG